MTVSVDQLLRDFGFTPSLEHEWRRESEDFVMVLEDAGDGEWLLSMAAKKETPRLQLAGQLGQCLVFALSMAITLQATMFPDTAIKPSA
ncbi:MAG: hypothetical protein GTN70_07915 [Deltaproteobacteria bacterium]|nr:hypothetical protein [Deltaproteobacteria bacterium]